MTDRVPGAPGRYTATITASDLQKLQAGEAFNITLTRNDAPITEGTPYSKAAVLPDALASVLCPDVTDPSPADAFSALLALLNAIGADGSSVIGIEHGGTGKATAAEARSALGAEPAFTKNNAFNKNFGTAEGTVCQGNDSRLSNARRASNITMSLSGTTLTITIREAVRAWLWFSTMLQCRRAERCVSITQRFPLLRWAARKFGNDKKRSTPAYRLPIRRTSGMPHILPSRIQAHISRWTHSAAQNADTAV